jgi:hypothetical protein
MVKLFDQILVTFNGGVSSSLEGLWVV